MQPSIHPTDARGSGGLESAAGRRRHRDAECEMAHLKRQIDWFRPQIFGHKSERRIVPVDTGQMSLGEGLTSPETGSPPPTPTQPVAAHHRRRVAQNPGTAGPLPFFDADPVPMEVITPRLSRGGSVGPRGV